MNQEETLLSSIKMDPYSTTNDTDEDLVTIRIPATDPLALDEYYLCKFTESVNEERSNTDYKLGTKALRSDLSSSPNTVKKEFLCDLCGYGVDDESVFELHKLSHEKNKALSTSVCDFSASSKKKFKNVIEQTGEKPSYFIEDNLFSTSLEKTLLNAGWKFCDCEAGRAFKREQKSLASKSRISPKRSRRYGNMQKCKDMQTCSKEMQTCSKEIQNCKDKSGVQTSSGGQVTRLYCNICGCSTASSYSLARHMKAHTGEAPYSCDVCGYAVSRRDYLVRHLQSHIKHSPVSPDSH